MARFGFTMLQFEQPTDALAGKGNPAVPQPTMKQVNPNASDLRNALNAPMLTPSEVSDKTFTQDNTDADAFGPDGTRTTQLPLAPGSWQETRVMVANRAGANWTPGAYYENQDPQKGGTPGAPGGADGFPASTNFITSQGPDGITRPGAAPPSPLKLSYGWSDWRHDPTFVGAHIKIQWNANPNKPQLNPTPFNTEGPSMNTRYSTPAPFAAGTFIG